MTEPSVEEIVARVERGLRHMDAHTFPEYPLPGDIRALIASWRERGKVIEQMQTRYEGSQKMMSADELQGLYDSMKP